MLRKLVPLIVLVLTTVVPFSSQASTRTPHINRVFIYVVENESASAILGNPKAPYLNSLTKRFVYATNYTATGHASLDNYIAMTSGQPPNPATMGDCAFYGTPLCIQNVANIGDQMEAAHLSWKGYMDSMPGPCAHTKENTEEPSQNGYAPRHNPFVYYADIVHTPARCNAHDVPLTQLWKDQASGHVPRYSFITPDTCHDGHDTGPPCKEGGGIPEADKFASRTIPKILADPSWKNGGLLVVTFDEGGVSSDSIPDATSGSTDFGGRVFTVLAYPGAPAGRTFTERYDHYGLLKTTEDIFCLPYLAGASLPSTNSMLPAIGQTRCAPLSPAAASDPGGGGGGGSHGGTGSRTTVVAAATASSGGELPRTGPDDRLTVAVGLALAMLGLFTLALVARGHK